MAKVYKSARWQDGDTLLKDDINAELENYVGEMAGHLDRDNVTTGLITGAKFLLDTFNIIPFEQSTTPLVLTRDAANDQQWFTILSKTITTGDGRLEIEGQATWGPSRLDLGILLDGTPVARSGTSGALLHEAAAVIACPAVGPGPHTVELAIRIDPDNTLTPITTTVNERCLWTRFMRR